ncbi:MAG: hypothetical protein U1F66_10715 [bacterium]
MEVIHVNIPAFAVAVEQRVDPRLRGRPVAIAASTAPRAPLLAVSAEAFGAGIHAGDRACDALKLEPRLRVLPQNPPLYERAQRKLGELVDRFTPLVEPARPGSFYLDMSGMESLFGKAPDAAGLIHRRIREALGLEAALGVARNKLVSRIAAKVIRPQGLCDVFAGGESCFLAPLEVEYLPGIGDKTQERLLRELGVRRICDLAAGPAPVLAQVFGRRGATLKAQAEGRDEEPVRPPQRRLELDETATLSQESNDEGVLLAELWRLVETLGAELRRRALVAGRAGLSGLYLDRSRARREVDLRPPTNLDFRIFAVLAAAWRKFLPRRVALKSIGLRLDRLQPEFQQADLFRDAREERILRTLDELRARYGTSVIRAGRALR